MALVGAHEYVREQIRIKWPLDYWGSSKSLMKFIYKSDSMMNEVVFKDENVRVLVSWPKFETRAGEEGCVNDR